MVAPERRKGKSAPEGAPFLAARQSPLVALWGLLVAFAPALVVIILTVVSAAVLGLGDLEHAQLERARRGVRRRRSGLGRRAELSVHAHVARQSQGGGLPDESRAGLVGFRHRDRD